MKQHWFIRGLRLIPALLLISSVTAAADTTWHSGTERNTLIELFTSQGCSSCPPAERWLGSLRQDPRLWHSIIPVAFHVDYWDYLGWKDPHADTAFSERQRRYHRLGKLSAVYTPGFVVNGREWRRYFGATTIPLAREQAGILSVTLRQHTLSARYTPSDAIREPLLLNLAVLGVGLHTRVTRGENAGRDLPQDFVVLGYRRYRSQNGLWTVELPESPAIPEGRQALAVWISRPGNPAPLQAVGGWLP